MCFFIFLLLVKICTVFINSPKFIEHFYDYYTEFSWVDCLFPPQLFLLLLFLSSSFIWNMFICHLILPNPFFFLYVLGWLVIILNLGEAILSRKLPMVPSSILPFDLHSCMIRGSPKWIEWALLFFWPMTKGMLVRSAGLLSVWCQVLTFLEASGCSWTRHSWSSGP